MRARDRSGASPQRSRARSATHGAPFSARDAVLEPRWMRAAARLVRFAQRRATDVACRPRRPRTGRARWRRRSPSRSFPSTVSAYDVTNCGRHRNAARRLHHAGGIPARSRGDDSDAQSRRTLASSSRAAKAVAERSRCTPAIRELCARARQASISQPSRRSGADVYVVNAAGCGSTLQRIRRALRRTTQWRERAARFSSACATSPKCSTRWNLSPHAASDRWAGDLSGAVPSRARTARDCCAAPFAGHAFRGCNCVEMNESAVCCGSAGIYNLTEPEMAGRLLEAKVANMRRTGADSRRDRESRMRDASCRRITGAWHRRAGRAHRRIAR